MDDDEYKRLLAAYEADKEQQNSTQIQLNNYTPKYDYSNSTQYNKSKDEEIWKKKKKFTNTKKIIKQLKNILVQVAQRQVLALFALFSWD